MIHLSRRLLHAFVAIGVIAALTVLGFGPGLNGAQKTARAQTAPAFSFGPSTVVDDQREGGEPDVAVCGPAINWSYGNCGQDNPYASAPYGFSTTSSWIWRSEDQSKTFKLVPSNNTTGKPDACPGGGDTDLQVSPGTTQATDFLNFIDLQGLTNFSTGVSKDGGTNFTCDSASSVATVVDRQWFGIYKNPAGAPANGGAVYVDYDQVAGAQCASDPNADGNTFVVQKSLDNGLTYAPPVVVDCNDGIAGNMEVNQTNGHVFAIHTSYANPVATTANPNTSVGSDAVTVDRSTDGGTTWTRHVVYACPPTATTDCTTGQDFAVLAIDKAQNLYAVWAQAPTDRSGNITGPSHIFISYSSNEGTTWSAARQLDRNVTTNVDLFPWVVAGNAGAVDVVWYGTAKASNVTSFDSGSQQSAWYPYFSQSLNANTTNPTFSQAVTVSQHPNHWGGICTMGIGCTTGGDRSLADFFQVTVNRSGGADIVWTDTSNNGNTSASGNASGLIEETRQLAGTTLFGTTLNNTVPDCTNIGAIPCTTDQTRDARYELNNMVGPNVPRLDITGSSLNIDPGNHTRLDARIKITPQTGGLPTLTDAGLYPADKFIDYLVSWNYHVPWHTDANYDSTGNIYYAYLEVNLATGATTAYDGNTCVIATTKPKYFVYPGQNAISSHFDPATGQIDLYVPLKDVGNPALGASLYSVTAHTVGQAAPAGPDNCSTRDPNGNPTDGYGQIFNVYDKSPAYNSVLTINSP